MAKYIDAEAVIETIKTRYYPNTEWDQRAFRFNAGISRAIHDISCAPAADVAPVRHGRWAECPIADGIDQCSQCTFMVPEQNHYPYCPNCGAKMDEE